MNADQVMQSWVLSLTNTFFRSLYGESKVLIGTLTHKQTSNTVSVTIPYFLPGLYRADDASTVPSEAVVKGIMSATSIPALVAEYGPELANNLQGDPAPKAPASPQGTLNEGLPEETLLHPPITSFTHPANDPSIAVVPTQQDISNQKKGLEKALERFGMYLPDFYGERKCLFPLFPGYSGPSDQSNAERGGAPWKFQVRFLRVMYPIQDKAILTQWLALNADFYTFPKVQETMEAQAFSRPLNGPSVADTGCGLAPAGIKVALAGRIPTQKSIPRKTVETFHYGTLTSSNGETGKSTHTFTSKNKLGAYSFKVTLIE